MRVKKGVGMHWSKDVVLEFIELYRSEKALWNYCHRGIKNRNAISEAWERLQNAFSLNVSVDVLKRKKESIMTTYRLMKKKGTTNWFAFEAMDSFLSLKYETMTMHDSESISHNADDYSQVTEFETEILKRDDFASSSSPFQPKYQNRRSGRYFNKKGHNNSKVSQCKTLKKRRRASDDAIDRAIKQLKIINDDSKNEENEFDLFCKSLAVQLKNMPIHRALLCQQELLSVMIKERLSSVDMMPTQSSQYSQRNSPNNQPNHSSENNLEMFEMI